MQQAGHGLPNTSSPLYRAVERIQDLMQAESRALDRGRRLELVPSRRVAANVYFRRASELRRARLAVMAEWNLI